MTVGERRERIQIVSRSRTQRADGGFDLSETTATRWAKVWPVAARENEQAGRIRGSTTYMVECDARGVTITTDDKIIWVTQGNMVLNVREVRTPGVRTLPLQIVAESGAVVSG